MVNTSGLVAWIKMIENNAARYHADDPLHAVDVSLMWDELGISAD